MSEFNIEAKMRKLNLQEAVDPFKKREEFAVNIRKQKRSEII